jgi:hypothetical protein
VPESSATLLRAGGYASFSIIPVLIASGIAFWLFLNGAGAIFGPINDLLVVISLALLALPVLAIRSMVAQNVGQWFDVVTMLALVGIAVASVGQLLLVFGVIPLQSSFVTGSLGILPVLVWGLGVGIIAGRIGALPDQLGWVTLALFAMIVVVGIGSAVLPGPAITVVTVGLVATMAGWLVVIGWTCLSGLAHQPLPVSG